MLRARKGDGSALELLCERYRHPLVRWAHGRLPRWAREGVATEDLVQDTFLALRRTLADLDVDAPGSLEAYLRAAVNNRLRDEIRRAKRRPAVSPLVADPAAEAPSPLEQVIGRQSLERFEAALGTLEPGVRGLVIARLELEMSYQQIAEAFGRPSADAARMAVTRAVVRLAEEMARRG